MDTPLIRIIFALLLSYLLGSIPSSYWLGKIFKGIDIRQHGSGNPGGTNALRVLGKPLGIATIILDIGKGWLPVFISQKFLGITNEWILVLIGIMAVLGHIYTIFLNFHGGKGVATTFGIFLGFTPMASLITMVCWAVFFLVTRYGSVASLVSAICFPILIYYFKYSPIYFGLSLLLGIFIIYKHRSNIQRLFKGTEQKVNLSGKK